MRVAEEQSVATVTRETGRVSSPDDGPEVSVDGDQDNGGAKRLQHQREVSSQWLYSYTSC